MEGRTSGKIIKPGTKKKRSKSKKASKEAMFKVLEVKLELSQKQIVGEYRKFMKNHP